MTKKDYELIAHAIFQSRYINDLEKNAIRRNAGYAILSLTATNLISALQNDNPRFDVVKFREACRL